MERRGRIDGELARSLIKQLAEALDGTGLQREIVIAGGSLLAWHDLLEATQDIDCLTRLDDDIRKLVAEIGDSRELPRGWLNDHARPFTPVTLERSECDVLFEAASLRLLGIPFRLLFLMKLDRGSAHDVADMTVLWPLVRQHFTSPEHVVREFYEAFPWSMHDEYLASFVAQIISKAER